MKARILCLPWQVVGKNWENKSRIDKNQTLDRETTVSRKAKEETRQAVAVELDCHRF
jgi:hypothetical protein